MNRYFWFLIIFLCNNCLGQNIGIGIATPLNKVHVLGNLLVNAPYTYTNTLPTAGQTLTMINGTTLQFAGSDSTGRIYDPGGAAGNYNSNLLAQVILNVNSTSAGYELILEDVDLGTGDSLLVRIDNNPVAEIGNGYTTLGKWIVNAPHVYITFKSNNDGINGRGFNLRIRRLYDVTGTQQPLTGQVGKSLFFDTKNGALRAGTISASPIGNYSTGLGLYSTASGMYSASIGGANKASGDYSFATGYGTTASGHISTSMGYSSRAEGDNTVAIGYITKATANNATAFGSNTTASGQYSTVAGQNSTAFGLNSIALGTSAVANGNYSLALGFGPVTIGNYSTAIGLDANSNGENSFAIGNSVYVNGNNAFGLGNSISAGGSYSTALGNFTTASGSNSTAMGNGTTASGHFSTAMGNYVTTSGFNGAFALGDNSTTTIMSSFVANGFRSRFAGGYRLLTNSAASLGVVLIPDGGSWSAISDVRLKENFLPVDAESILKKIATLPLTTWNYTEQSRKTSRHYGPMAQDFYKAFGHDELGEIGCDTLINQQDFLGVNLIAIQALEKRTVELSNRLEKAFELITQQIKEIDLLKEQNKNLSINGKHK